MTRYLCLLGALLLSICLLPACGPDRGAAHPVALTLNSVRFVDTQGPPPDPSPMDDGPSPAPYLRLLQPTGEALVKEHAEASPLTLQEAESVVGALVTIRWEARGVEAVRIDVEGGTLTEGKRWRILEGAERLPAEQGSFSFKLPLEWAGWGNVRYRVEDADAPESLWDISAEQLPGAVRCPGPLLMVNEVQVPDSTGRGGFVEITNSHRAALDLGGLRLTQPQRTGSETIHLFPEGFTVPAGGAVVLFTDAAAVTPMPEGAVSALMTGPSMFGPTTASLWLKSPCHSSTQVSDFIWWNNGTDFFGTGFSATRWPDMSAAYTQSMNVAAGLRSSPGYRADGVPFTAPVEGRLPLTVDMPDAPPAFLVTGSASSSVRLTVKGRGGTPPYRFSLDPSAPVPPGLTMDSTSGQLTWLGPPAGVTASVTVRVDDASLFPVRVSKVLTLETVPNLGAGVATILARSLLPARVGRLFGAALAGVGGLVWSVTSGSLPPGLTLHEDEYLSGEPTTPGSYTFTVRLTCPGPSVSCPGGTTTAERSLTLEVLPE